ncbi:MAG: tripartite tricarboxylate transporter TctB family protein [Pygmaiobacter sp.]
MKKQIHHDVWVGAILLAFSIWVLVIALSISGQAAILPIALCAMMALCAAIVLINGLRKTKAAEGEFSYEMTLKDSKPALMFLLFIFIYYFGFRYIGYWATTPAFLVLTQKYLKVKSWKLNIIITVSYMVIAFVLFVVILKLPIYKIGILGPCFRFI